MSVGMSAFGDLEHCTPAYEDALIALSQQKDAHGRFIRLGPSASIALGDLMIEAGRLSARNWLEDQATGQTNAAGDRLPAKRIFEVQLNVLDHIDALSKMLREHIKAGNLL